MSKRFSLFVILTVALMLVARTGNAQAKAEVHKVNDRIVFDVSNNSCSTTHVEVKVLGIFVNGKVDVANSHGAGTIAETNTCTNELVSTSSWNPEVHVTVVKDDFGLDHYLIRTDSFYVWGLELTTEFRYTQVNGEFKMYEQCAVVNGTETCWEPPA